MSHVWFSCFVFFFSADFVVPGAGGMVYNPYPGYAYQNGVAYFTPEGVPQAPPFPHQALLAMPYVQPQQHYAPAAYNTPSTGQQWGGQQQWRWAGQNPAVTQAAPTYGSPPAYGVEYYPSPNYPAEMGGIMEATPAEVAPMMPAFDPAMQANVTYSVQTPVPAVDYTRTAGMVSWRKPGTPRRYGKPLMGRRPAMHHNNGVAVMDSKDGEENMAMSALPADE
ncbi:uncharacterized protein LOC118424753 [Branchiostoma floridae]|uniref:Uncharacterized protein LOC118424753 n=1 Tax=Branchiostoma floridae TaxID=7739 RepID=A0A9J7LVS0_BRAFL|nr:uncharacterized protein LOC118424753 [Branchiostoma floridae]